MSRKDFQGSAYAFQKLMEAARDEIASGDRKGVKVTFATPDRETTHIVTRVKSRLLRLLRTQA
jgi:hypothetical protein